LPLFPSFFPIVCDLFLLFHSIFCIFFASFISFLYCFIFFPRLIYFLGLFPFAFKILSFVFTSICLLIHTILQGQVEHISLYLFLLVSCLTCNLLFKTLKFINVKIFSTSLMYAHYMFRPTLVIFRCL
jgi:hypothetical protein